jgi:hypothetical protein
MEAAMLRAAASQSNSSLSPEGPARSAVLPSSNRILQRKCACGGEAGLFGPCEECQKGQRPAVQRAGAGRDAPATVPPIVHEVLRSPGQPLDAETRAFMEPRFGQDFSGVRVHADAKAAKSAQAVNALAYTVGREVVFGPGQYAPNSISGQRLLVHELVHVLQQQRAPQLAPQPVRISNPVEESEQDADRVAAHLLPPANQPGWLEGPWIQRQIGPGAALFRAVGSANYFDILQRATDQDQSPDEGQLASTEEAVDPRCEHKMKDYILKEWVDPLIKKYTKKTGDDFDAFSSETLSKFDTTEYQQFKDGEDYFECCARYFITEAIHGTKDLPSVLDKPNSGKQLMRRDRKDQSAEDKKTIVFREAIPLSDGNAFHLFYALALVPPQECQDVFAKGATDPSLQSGLDVS